jgi:hypothetical protein
MREGPADNDLFLRIFLSWAGPESKGGFGSFEKSGSRVRSTGGSAAQRFKKSSWIKGLRAPGFVGRALGSFVDSPGSLVESVGSIVDLPGSFVGKCCGRCANPAKMLRFLRHPGGECSDFCNMPGVDVAEIATTRGECRGMRNNPAPVGKEEARLATRLESLRDAEHQQDLQDGGDRADGREDHHDDVDSPHGLTPRAPGGPHRILSRLVGWPLGGQTCR